MTNCFHIVLQECGPSGVPNGQWMKVPRPGKTRDTCNNTSIQFHETFPAICNFCAYDCVTSSPTMNILVLVRSQCRCWRILWKKHKRYMEEHRAHQRVFCVHVFVIGVWVCHLCVFQAMVLLHQVDMVQKVRLLFCFWNCFAHWHFWVIFTV